MLLRRNIYEELKADIIACRLPPGTELREQELTARHGVSRSPVRDALLRLEGDGLVMILPRQGYRVNAVSLEDARDLFRLRRLLEPEAAREAARHADDASLDALQRFAAWNDETSFIDYNREFHCALAGLARNRRLAATAMSLIEQADRLVRISLDSIKDRQPDRLVAEHAAIIDALQARDGARAARLLRVHIIAAEARVLPALKRRAESDATIQQPGQKTRGKRE